MKKVTTVSLTELLLVSMKSGLAVLMLYEQTPVKQPTNDFNWNKDVTVEEKHHLSCSFSMTGTGEHA